MAIRMAESPESRPLHYGASGGGQTRLWTAVTTAGETEAQVWLYALTQSTAYYNGFIRRDVKVTPKGAPNLFDVEVEYGTTGLGGGDQPLGGTGNDGGAPPNPSGPADDTTPLTGGYQFNFSPERLHITQSLETISATKRGGGTAKDFLGKIGVGKDLKVEGCEIPPDAPMTWSRTVARAVVTRAYMRTVRNLCGKVNNASWYGFDEGELIYLGASGQYTQGEGWSITHNFGAGQNRVNITICEDLVVPAKKAFEYLWVLDEEIDFAGDLIVVPGAAYVEKVLEAGDFSLIEIGT